MAEFNEGDSARLTKTLSDEDVRTFAEISGDHNPVHLDEDFAAGTRFGRRIAHGMLTAGLISAVLGTQLPGPGTIYLGQTLQFLAPVYLGESVTATVTLRVFDRDRGRMTLETVCTTEDGKEVLRGEAQVLYRP